MTDTQAKEAWMMRRHAREVTLFLAFSRKYVDAIVHGDKLVEATGDIICGVLHRMTLFEAWVQYKEDLKVFPDIVVILLSDVAEVEDGRT